MEIRCSQESQDAVIIKNFSQAVEFEYSRQRSTPTPPKWIQMQELVNLLKPFINITIIGKHPQRLFIEDLLKYIELVMDFLSNYEDTEYRKQRNYGITCLTFIPEIFKDAAFKSMFIQEATVKMLDLFMYGNFNLVSKKTLLVIYNEIARQSNKHVRQEVASGIMYYMYKLLDCLSTHGDYVLQSGVLEALFRIFGRHIRNNEKIVKELLPGYDDLGKALTTEISVNQFDADVRTWLNRFNQDSPYIFSIVCKKIMFGSQVCLPPENMNKTWVDFNLKEPMLNFYCQGSSPGSWNRLIIIGKDVEKVEVKRLLGANESTVSIQMSTSCISEEHGSQDYYDKLEKLLILIISHEEKDKLTKLITTVLPRVFGDTFSHTSAKISAIPRNVYELLPIKVSRRKSSSSVISIATTLSKSKSDRATIDNVNVSSVIPVRKSLLPGSVDSRTAQSETVVPASDHIRPSCFQRSKVIENNVSAGITDMTRYSHRSNLTSEKFLSSRLTSPINSEYSFCSRRKGNVYKPMPINVSRRKSDASVVSIATTLSKRKSDGATIDNFKVLSVIPVRKSLLHGSVDSQTVQSETVVPASDPIRRSCFQRGIALENNFSVGTITDMTRYSHRTNLTSDHITISTSDNLDIFPSSKPTSPINSEDSFCSRSKGRCSGRSTDYQRLEEFHHSEVFSSTPNKISDQKNFQDISNAFSPSPPLQDDVEQDGYRTKNITDTKVSCLISQEETLDEDFETAAENMENEFLNMENYLFEANNISHNSDVRKGQYTLKESYDGKGEISEFKMQIHYSKIADKAEKNFPTLLQNKSKDNSGRVQNGVDLDTEPVGELRIVQKSRDQFSDNSVEVGEASLVPTIDEKPNDEISTDSTTKDNITNLMQANVPISEIAKNDVLLNNERVSICLINDNNELFTESIYEAATQEYKKITDSAEVLQEHSSEDVSIRPQYYDQTTEEFTDKLSLTVNVGISENIDNKEDNKEDIIDLTLDDHADVEEREVKLKDNKKEYVLKKVGATKKPLLNSPELLDIPSTGNSMNECLTETGQNQMDDITPGKVSLTSSKESYPVKEVIVKKKAEIGKTKQRTLLKTGKKRFDMGDDVEEVLIVRATDKNKNEEPKKQDQAERTKPVVLNFDEENTEKANCVEQSSKEINSVQGTSMEQASKTSNVQGTNMEQFNKEMVGNKMINEEDVPSSPLPSSFEPITKHLMVLLPRIDVKNKLENSTSNSELELAPEVNVDNVDYIEKFNKLKQSDEDNRLVKDVLSSPHPFSFEPITKHLVVLLPQIDVKNKLENSTSSSELELAPEVNMDNVDYIEKFNKLKQPDQENTFVKDNQKATEAAVDVPSSPHPFSFEPITKDLKVLLTQIDVKNKLENSTSSSELELAPEVNMDNVDYIEKFNKLKQSDEENRLVKDNQKATEAAVGSREEQTKKDEVAISVVDKEHNLESAKTPETQEKQVKLSKIVNKETKVQRNKQPKRKVVVINGDQQESISPSNLASLNDVIPSKTPDTSPELTDRSKAIVTTAQTHWVEDCLKPDEGQKKTEALKSGSNYPDQDCQKVKPELHISSKKEDCEYKRKYEFFDEVLVEKTRSNDRIKKESDDDFDKFAAAIPLNNSTVNKSGMNVTGRSKRKLFIPGNLSYLDEMPDITERKTPELDDDMSIAVVKGPKLRKRKKAELINKKVKPKPGDKSKTTVERSKKTKQSPKEKIPRESSKPQTKPRLKRGRRKEFSLSTTKFMDLEDLFNKTCRSLRNNTSTGGFDTLYRPIDIAASKKQTSLMLPDTFGVSTLPPTPLPSSEFEIELPPINKDVPDNIILQDIIKSKRPSREFENKNNKRRKLNQTETGENIVASTLPEIHQFIDDIIKPIESPNENNNYEDNKTANPIVETCLEEIIKLQKDVSKLLEVSLQKIKVLKE